MKMQFSTNDPNYNEIGEKTFNVVANDKMFKILSSGIYTDKILAPIRELSTNAYDAHVDSGKTNIPFDVKLPSDTDMIFYIRDYGKGMSKHQIQNLYTTYGYSTKSTSDEFVGCLGLGSKSPFAYTNNFIVTSFHGDMCYRYNCYLVQGVPKIQLLDEFETEEDTGIKVQFVVKNVYDVRRFRATSLQFYKWFQVFPNFVGQKITIEKPTEVRKNVYKKNGMRELNFLMGNILYQTSWFDIKSRFIDKQIDTTSLDSLRNCDFVYRVPIGYFDISVSRQNIEYSDRNLNNIKILLDDFIKVEACQALQKINKQETKYLKLKMANNILAQKRYLFNDIKINSEDVSFSCSYESEDNVILKFYYTNSNGKSTCCNTIKGKQNFDFRGFLQKYNFTLVYDQSEKLNGSNNYRQFINQSKYNQFVIITNNKVFLNWCRQIGIPEKSKQFFDKYKIKSSKKQVFYRITRGRTAYKFYSKGDNIQTLNEEQKIYYVQIKGHEILGDCKKNFYWVEDFQKYLGKTIYGLRNKQYQIYKDDQRFVNALEEYNKVCDSIMKEYKTKFQLYMTSFYNKNLQFLLKSDLRFDTKLMNLQLIEQYQNLLKLTTEQKIVLSEKQKILMGLVGNNIQCLEFNQLMSYIHDMFPLLRSVMNRYYYDGLIDNNLTNDIKNYVKMKEEIMRYEKI